jgi:hypothetical protein
LVEILLLANSPAAHDTVVVGSPRKTTLIHGTVSLQLIFFSLRCDFFVFVLGFELKKSEFTIARSGRRLEP